MARTNSKNKKHQVLEYQVNISFDPRDELYVARVPELEGCATHGSTPEEALHQAGEAIQLWIETAHDEGLEIPEPLSRRKYSGKFVVRTPAELHAKLAQEALRRGQSMNELTVELLRKALKAG